MAKTIKNSDASKSSKTKLSNRNVEQGKGTADELNGILENASNIVLKAAHILEAEVARGIVAAKEIEKKIVDPARFTRTEGEVDKKSSEELLIRFRKDAHDIVDLLVDLATLASDNASKLSSRLMTNIAKEPVEEKENKEASKG